MDARRGLPPFDLWRTFTAATEVMAASSASPATLASLQSRRLAALLAAAAQGSAIYRELIGDRPDQVRLQDLPVARKPDLMRQFDLWVTDPGLKLAQLQRFTADPSRIADAFAGRYVVWESSGSSGEPGIFVQDAQAMAVYDALEALRRPVLQPLRLMFDSWGMAERMVFVGATDGHFASMVSVSRLRRLNPGLAGRLHSVSFLQSTPDLLAELEALRPTAIATYPSVALLLAQERQAGRTTLAPREVWTGGENLTPTMRACIGQAFDCPVVDSYGASEFFSLACECRHGRMHLNSDWAILESINADGHVLPEGQLGATTLLTNLANHVQPLIRYDIGDHVLLRGDGCACGSHLPVIEVHGRDDDMLRLGAGDAVSVLPLALCTVLEDEAQLFDFQVVQDGVCALSLRTGLQGDAARSGLARACAALAAYLQRIGAVDVHVRARPDQALLRGRSGKVRRVLAMPSL